MTFCRRWVPNNVEKDLLQRRLYDKPLATPFVVGKLSQRFCTDSGLLRRIRDMSAAARVRTKAETAAFTSSCLLFSRLPQLSCTDH